LKAAGEQPRHVRVGRNQLPRLLAHDPTAYAKTTRCLICMLKAFSEPNRWNLKF
jgi:hypothetical protein